MNIEYKKDGLLIDGELILLGDIVKNCHIQKIKEEKLLLLKLEWVGWRGFEEGIKEQIVIPIEKIEIVKKFMLGKTIYFGEIAGKHSEVYNTLDEDDIKIVEDIETITNFLLGNPSGHEYNHSFINTFSDRASDGEYDISEEDLKEFETIFN